MKKILLTALISLLALPGFAADDVDDIFQDLRGVGQSFFQSSIIPNDVLVREQGIPRGDIDYSKKENNDKFVDHMPLFKKTRLRIQNAYSGFSKKSEEKALLREQERERKLEEKERKEVEDLDIKYLEYSGNSTVEVSDKKKGEEAKPAEEAPKELVGGVREQVTQKEMQLDCDTVVMNDETGDIEAIGNPILSMPQNNINLTADKMIYNRDSNILRAIGNVVLTKDGMPIYGDYMQVNMNEENILIDNMTAAPKDIKISARKAESDNDKLILTEGKIFSEKSNKFKFHTRMMGPDFSRMIVSEEDMSSYMTMTGENKDKPNLRLVSAQIDVKADREHDVYSLRDTEVYYKDRYLFTWPSFTAYTNKKREYFEANYPEFGSQSKFGMYAGPGIVLQAPYGSTLKLIPLVNYRNKFGFGGALKFKSAFNDTQIMYGSSENVFVVRGRQELDENLFLQYGSNSYMDDWFMGLRMPKYMAELVYHKDKKFNNFLGKDLDLTYSQRATAGYAHDGDWNMHTEHLKGGKIGTARFKYMAQANQTLWAYRNEEERKAVELNLLLQGSAAVYGTGDTQFVGRVGPMLHTQYKYWMQDIIYYISGYSDQTPMPIFDKYRYGHSNLYIREALRLNKYLSVGWAGSITVSNDSPNGQMFQENAFIVSLGPDDLKVNLGYDFMRRITYFTVSVILDSKNTQIEYDKMTIKNPERMGHSDKKNDDSIYMQTTASADAAKNPKAKRLKYAEVIDIEDPDKEKI